jgi:hypothetical protein
LFDADRTGEIEIVAESIEVLRLASLMGKA